MNVVFVPGNDPSPPVKKNKACTQRMGNKTKIFLWGLWEGIVLQLPHRLTTSSNTVFR